MRKFNFYWHMVIASLLRRKSRMLVAMLAVAIGATILCGLLLIYFDVPEQLAKEFRSYGANLIVLPQGNDHKLTEESIAQVKSVIPKDQVVGLAPYAYHPAKVNEQPYTVAATNFAEAKANSPYWLIDGSWPSTKRQVLLGKDVANEIGLSVGDKFQISATTDEEQAKQGDSKKTDSKTNSIVDLDKNMTKRDFVVSGIVTTGGAEEALIFMSFSDLKTLVKDYDGKVDVLECSVKGDTTQLQQLANEIEAKASGVFTRLAKRLTTSQDQVLAKLQSLVWLVTLIVLALTMISVSTTMMAVVAERRKEIGLKKALGASDKGVMQDFFGEGALLGVCGGLIGSILGYLFAVQVSVNVFARSIAYRPLVVPLTVLLTVAITMLACIYPVRKTLEIKPAIVLKGE